MGQWFEWSVLHVCVNFNSFRNGAVLLLPDMATAVGTVFSNFGSLGNMSVSVACHKQRVSFDVMNMMENVFVILKRMLPKQIA